MQKLTASFLSAFLLSSLLFSQPVANSGAALKEALLNLTAPQATTPQTIAQGDVQFDEKKSSDADDMEALRRWIRDKRMVTVKEIGGDLSISGDVRTEFQDTSEVKNGIQQMGNSVAPLDKARYGWDVEVNIMIDYRTDRTWAAIKLEFNNDMGVSSGTINKIRLEKGYLGGRMVNGDTFTMDGEIGRRFLFNVFESKIEFVSLFDGALIRFNKAFDQIGDFYCNLGALVVNDKTNHYAYIGEIGALKIANTGLYMKYSIIDWHKPTANEIAKHRYDFLVSQFLSYIQVYPDWIGNKLIKVYGAGLYNHFAEGVVQTHGKKQNWGWYTGVAIGTLRKQYDWAIDVNYQWAQAQVVPEFDCLGIGRGNAAGAGLYTVNSDGTGGAQIADNAVGSTNYKGFQLEGLYAFTDNLTIQQSFSFSTTLNKNIGPNVLYKQYELEFIYAF